jgi:lysophospholipid acyltransferase (LPLAT)-like uncharacterized protein
MKGEHYACGDCVVLTTIPDLRNGLSTVLLRVHAHLLYVYVRTLLRTVTVCWPEKPDDLPRLIWCWHEDVVVATVVFLWAYPSRPPVIAGLANRRGDAIRAAYARFGGDLTQLADRKHPRDGAATLATLAAKLFADSPILIVPDGPRGPRHEPRSGVALLADQASVDPVRVAFRVRPQLRLPRWDRQTVLIPFSRVSVSLTEGPPR